MKTKKEIILGKVTDLAFNLMFTDRKGCEELPEGSIQDAVYEGELSVDDMVDRFRSELLR